MEPVDVDRHGVHVLVGVVAFELLGVLEEEAARIEARQRILLGGADDALALAELHDTAHAGANDLRHVVGLRQKVRRAELKAAELRRGLAREDDDRDARKLGIVVHRLQHGEAVHLRHVEIEHHQ